MYCENCGHALHENDKFCESCGNAIERVILKQENKSNKTLWIVLGSIFGGLLLLGVLGVVFLTFIFVDYNTRVKEAVDYEIDDNYNSALQNLETDDEYLEMYSEIRDVYFSTKDIYNGEISYYNQEYVFLNNLNYNNLVLMVLNATKDNDDIPIEVSVEKDIDVEDKDSFKALDDIGLDYYKVNNIYIRSLSNNVVIDKVKKAFNVDYRADEIDSNYFYDICDGYFRFVENDLSYKFYYKECGFVDEYFTKIYNIQMNNDDILVKEYVGYNLSDFIYDEYKGDYVSSVDTIKYHYDELDKFEKVFKKNENDEYYLYSVREIQVDKLEF